MAKELTRRIERLECGIRSKRPDRLVVAELPDGSRYVLRDDAIQICVPPRGEPDRRGWIAKQPGAWRRLRPADLLPGPRGEPPPELVVFPVVELAAFGLSPFLRNQRPGAPGCPSRVGSDRINERHRSRPMGRSID